MCVPASGASARVPKAPWSVGDLGGPSSWPSWWRASIPLMSRKAAREPQRPADRSFWRPQGDRGLRPTFRTLQTP